MESSSVTARSRFLTPTAVRTRDISNIAVSLGETIHRAQIRPSTALAVSASGAAFKRTRIGNRYPDRAGFSAAFRAAVATRLPAPPRVLAITAAPMASEQRQAESSVRHAATA